MTVGLNMRLFRQMPLQGRCNSRPSGCLLLQACAELPCMVALAWCAGPRPWTEHTWGIRCCIGASCRKHQPLCAGLVSAVQTWHLEGTFQRAGSAALLAATSGPVHMHALTRTPMLFCCRIPLQALSCHSMSPAHCRACKACTAFGKGFECVRHLNLFSAGVWPVWWGCCSWPVCSWWVRQSRLTGCIQPNCQWCTHVGLPT